MRITNITLKNWGPHEKLELDMDSPVFGLLGENGCGKTNVLEAIDFCFTGVTERTQETYARRFQGESSNGSAELTFNKDGLTGKIFRQVGTSPRRWMEWDGEKYTKTADIDRILQEILDCDKKAVSMAVFLSQGHIGDFLFTTASVREDMFSKLCLVDHLSGVADIAGQKIVELQREVTDLTSVRDEALTNLSTATDILRNEEGELALHPDQTGSIRWLTTRIQRWDGVATAEAALQRQHGTLQIAKNKAAQRVLPGCVAPGSTPAQELAHRQAQAYAFDTAAQQLNDAQQQLTRRRGEIQARDTAIAQHKALQDSLLAIPPLQGETTVLTLRVAEAKAHLQGVAEQARVRDRHGRAVAAGNQTTEALGKLPETALLDLLEEQTKTELAELAPLGLGLNLAQKVEGKTSGCCPLCKSTDLSNLPSGAELQKQVDAFKLKHSTLTANQTQYTTQRSNRQLLEQQLRQQQLEFTLAAAEVAQLLELPPMPQGIADYQQLAVVEGQLRAKEQELTRLQASEPLLKNLEESIQSYATHLAATDSEEVLLPKIATLESAISGRDRVVASIQELKVYIQATAEDAQEVANAQAQIAQCESTRTAAQTALEEGTQYLPAGMVLEDPVTTRATLSARELQQQQRVQQEGKVTACAEALRRAEKRVKEVDDRIQGNARTREVINQLEQLREAFGRSGIPRHYLTQIFDALVEGTQENLSNWDSDFQVERDETKLFNFRFYRTNDPETLLDQGQLSGGQKMRLSISFLLAVQQLVMPELGFIVLDEPTYGLDDPGIEGLATLFRHMAVHLADVNSQVIVVTHDQLLKSSLAKSVTLTPVSEMQTARTNVA
jgi:DNA repair exonuclease SbcCD ATPase subunit